MIEGVSSQTTMSDIIYSAGCIIKCVSNSSIRHDDVKLALKYSSCHMGPEVGGACSPVASSCSSSLLDDQISSN